ncbi:MAG: tRNA (cytidine(34)-2'-O)-methyltransferase [bacterium]|nr:tRNA (cytidine(34)-2'-O)-methyltransferase [bacterium]
MVQIVLYQPQIPPNTGNIARLCVASGSRLHLIYPLGFRLDEPAARRAGLDYWKHLDLEEHASWEDFLSKYKDGRFFFFSKKVKKPYSQADYREGDFLIFGAETVGLPEEILKKYAEHTRTIPMWGKTRSLNLATSVGIVAYEALRQITRDFQAY